MSWIKEVFYFSNENKDPFVKFLFRLTFLVIFVVIVFLAYALITGKKIHWGSGDYFWSIINTTDSMKKSTTANVDTVKKTDTIKVITSPNLNNNNKSGTVNNDTLSKATNRNELRKIPKSINSESNNQNLKNSNDQNVNEGDEEVLTSYDKKWFIRNINLFTGDSKFPTYVRIDYVDDGNSTQCAYELRNYLKAKGFNISDFHHNENSNDDLWDGFVLNYYPEKGNGYQSFRIWVGPLKRDNDKLRYYTHSY